VPARRLSLTAQAFRPEVTAAPLTSPSAPRTGIRRQAVPFHRVIRLAGRFRLHVLAHQTAHTSRADTALAGWRDWPAAMRARLVGV